MARTWHVPADVPTIRAAIDSARVGDDVLVAPGTYPEAGIEMRGGVLVHTEQGPEVTIVDPAGRGMGFVCAGLQQEATIDGFRITNGSGTDAGGIYCLSSTVLVRNCWIDHCQAWSGGGAIRASDGATVRLENCRISETHGGQHVRGGIFCTQSSLVVENCVITANYGIYGGVYALGSVVRLLDCQISDNHPNGVMADGPSLLMQRCLVTQNGDESALSVWGFYELADCVISGNLGAVEAGGTGRIDGCTIVANDYNVFWLESELTHLSVERTIIAFNNTPVLTCPFPPEKLSFRCCDAYGNQDDEICGQDLGGNFSADPLFCDAANGDYTLNANSPCLPGHRPQGVNCGLIGARGVGCPPSAMEDRVDGAATGLMPGRPNPFVDETAIVFGLTKGSVVDLAIYDVSGRCVRRLASRTPYPAGVHQLIWKRSDDTGRLLPSGVFVCRLRVGDEITTSRLVVLR